MGPRLLRPDNLTPPQRTPWGGRRIPERYKTGLGIPLPEGPVGEAWEVSVEPSFPSRLADTGALLSDSIAADPVAWLGQAAAERHAGALPLLVKLLDSGDELSLQVHPSDGYPALGPGECGKPESWVVLEADPGAGIYLGWRDGVDRPAVEACLAAQGALDKLLSFIPVAPGDVFILPAGTPHAIGRGITLVEPQHVTPGHRGVTYRYWDWNRRYDANGRRDPAGQPRALHVAESLDATDWAAPTGDALRRACSPAPTLLDSGSLARHLLLEWQWFRVESWHGTGRLGIPCPGTLWAVTCVAGRARLHSANLAVTLPMGQSAVVPAAAGDLLVEGEDTHLVATRLPG